MLVNATILMISCSLNSFQWTRSLPKLKQISSADASKAMKHDGDKRLVLFYPPNTDTLYTVEPYQGHHHLLFFAKNQTTAAMIQSYLLVVDNE